MVTMKGSIFNLLPPTLTVLALRIRSHAIPLMEAKHSSTNRSTPGAFAEKQGGGYEGKKSPKASYPRKFETSDSTSETPCLGGKKNSETHRKIMENHIDTRQTYQGRCGPEVKQMLQSCLQCHRDSAGMHAF